MNASALSLYIKFVPHLDVYIDPSGHCPELHDLTCMDCNSSEQGANEMGEKLLSPLVCSSVHRTPSSNKDSNDESVNDLPGPMVIIEII